MPLKPCPGSHNAPGHSQQHRGAVVVGWLQVLAGTQATRSSSPSLNMYLKRVVVKQPRHAKQPRLQDARHAEHGSQSLLSLLARETQPQSAHDVARDPSGPPFLGSKAPALQHPHVSGSVLAHWATGDRPASINYGRCHSSHSGQSVLSPMNVRPEEAWFELLVRAWVPAKQLDAGG
jgi:hypothetical protein